MRLDRTALIRATTIGTVLQLAMVITGHFVPAVAMMFGLLGILLSAVAGVLYATRAADPTRGGAAWGGTLAGGICALIGIAVSFALGDVTALILLVGTLSSAVTGALGGVLGRAFGRGGRVAVAA